MKTIKEKIILLYQKGKTLRELAKITKLSHETIRQMIPKDKIRGKKNIDIDEIIELYEKLGTCKKVAEKLGISVQYAHKIVGSKNGRK